MTKTRLLIARHGNTFTPDQTPTRVGLHTDLPLVQSGQDQATRLAIYLKDNDLTPDKIYTSVLKRTIEMGQIVEDVIGKEVPQTQHSMFNEIDYGPDENMPEDAVIQRIGQDAITAWNKKTTVPDGWIVDPNQIIKDWISFGDTCNDQHQGQTVLAITSNGVARFSPHLTGDFDGFSGDLKISTGALCILEKSDDNDHWTIIDWNIRP
jgi:probable phosphoglycerate mutase